MRVRWAGQLPLHATSASAFEVLRALHMDFCTPLCLTHSLPWASLWPSPSPLLPVVPSLCEVLQTLKISLVIYKENVNCKDSNKNKN